MQVIPAIDLRGGRCVRLVQGDFDRETVFGEDPVEVARRWEAEGAERLHVVDLDGAREGAPAQLDTVARMARAVRIPIQSGGGLRTLDALTRAIDVGVDRIILGTVAVRDPRLVETACATYGERIAVGVDAREGRVAVDGWAERTELAARELVGRMGEAGVRTVIYTDIGRDGMLKGPNLPELADVAEMGVPVIASGGITSARDLGALATLEGAGVVGAIVGKALYTGALPLRDALSAASAATRPMSGRENGADATAAGESEGARTCWPSE